MSTQTFAEKIAKAEKEKKEYERGKTYFVDGLPYYTYLEPLYMLCIIDKKQMTFIKKRLL